MQTARVTYRGTEKPPVKIYQNLGFLLADFQTRDSGSVPENLKHNHVIVELRLLAPYKKDTEKYTILYTKNTELIQNKHINYMFLQLIYEQIYNINLG